MSVSHHLLQPWYGKLASTSTGTLDGVVNSTLLSNNIYRFRGFLTRTTVVVSCQPGQELE